jgi:hypothetical protein
MNSQKRDKTEARLLGFSYDFGVTVIRHQNADAMVLASALIRGCIHSPDNIENGRCPGGGNAYHISALARTMASAFL